LSGKKDLARLVRTRLSAIGVDSEILEGGQIRHRFEGRLGFSREQVEHNLRRITFEAKLLAEAGVVAIVVAISPFREHRLAARQTLGRFLEVYCRCPMAVLEERDSTGFYQRARAGKIKNVAGVSYPYEESSEPEVIYDSDREPVERGAQRVMEIAERIRYIHPADHSVLTRAEEEDLRQRLRDAWDR
jgi:adenylyl-sulfate kinase